MPKFLLGRDIDLFKSVARELVSDVIQNTIVLFKVNMNETKVNIYGEAMNKTWHPGIELFALVDKDPESARYEGFGLDTDQNVTFKLDRWMLEENNAYPEVGDIINWNGGYFEIDNTNEIQLVGGQPYNNFSVVCSTFMVSKSNLNIEERIK
jgi:hypothetical protein